MADKDKLREAVIALIEYCMSVDSRSVSEVPPYGKCIGCSFGTDYMHCSVKELLTTDTSKLKTENEVQKC